MSRLLFLRVCLLVAAMVLCLTMVVYPDPFADALCWLLGGCS